MDFLKSISMEELEFTLIEDIREVSVEFRVYLLHLLDRLVSANSIHQLINIGTSLISISPLLKEESELKLLLSKFENMSDVLFLIKSDRIGDLSIRLLIELENLVEVRVECFRNLSIIFFGVELFAESKHFSCGIIIEFQKS